MLGLACLEFGRLHLLSWFLILTEWRMEAANEIDAPVGDDQDSLSREVNSSVVMLVACHGSQHHACHCTLGTVATSTENR